MLKKGTYRSLSSRVKKYLDLRAIVRARRARKLRLLRPQVVPLEYTGKWVAWTPDGRKIIAAADSAREVQAAARERGVPDALYEWIPAQEELRSTSRPQEVSNL